MWLTRMSLRQVSVLLSYPIVSHSFELDPIPASPPTRGVVLYSVFGRRNREAAFSINIQFFLPAGLDWAGWASHAGTSQPGGWGVAVGWRKKEWRRRALPLTLEPELALLQNQLFNELHCTALLNESANFITGSNSTEHKAYQQPLRIYFCLQVSTACKQKMTKLDNSGEKPKTFTSLQTWLLPVEMIYWSPSQNLPPSYSYTIQGCIWLRHFS